MSGLEESLRFQCLLCSQELARVLKSAAIDNNVNPPAG